MMVCRVGEQLGLSLDDVRLKRRVELWGGVSPRVLTRSYNRFTLKAQGGGHGVDFRQVEMFRQFGRVPIRKKRNSAFGGAPTLQPLPPKRY